MNLGANGGQVQTIATPIATGDPSTCQLLARHARQQPTAVAIVDGRFETTYRALAASVLRAMDALTAAGIKQGQVVGVELDERHLHLIVLLACEALAVTTISLVPADLGPPANLDRLCDRIVASRTAQTYDPDKLFLITPDWMAHVLTSPVGDQSPGDQSPGDQSPGDPSLGALENPPAWDSFVRLIKTSGTTGVPKVMGMTHRVQQLFFRKNLLTAAPQICPHPCLLYLYRFSIRGAHSRAVLTLRLGGTIRFVGIDDLWDLIAAGIGNFLVFVAGDLERWLPTIPSGRGPFNLYIDVIGAAISPRLRRQTQAKLTTHVVVGYGTNEAHHISLLDENNVGTLYDNVQVMITDSDGACVPLGQHGLVRVKSDTMVDGYINAPELTRATFVDGWYHTSDRGFQPSPGKLVVLGRADDMMIIGGLKIAPAPIEERLKAIDGVLDAVVTEVTDPQGISLLLVAVETGTSGEPPDLGARVKAVIQPYTAPYQILTLPVFPRTETGKITRGSVQQIYRTAAQTRHQSKL